MTVPLRSSAPTLHFHSAGFCGVNASLSRSGGLEVQVLDFQIEERFVIDVGDVATLFAQVAAVVGPVGSTARVRQTSPLDELDGARLCFVDGSHRREVVVGASDDPGQSAVRAAAAALLQTTRRAMAGKTPHRRGGPAPRFPVDEALG